MQGATSEIMTAQLRERSSLDLFLTHSHEHLRDVFTRLLAAMEVNARDETRKLWNELERGLLSHMEAEERYVLPAFAHVDKGESLALLREHGLIREQLFLLGIAVDLHYIRYESSLEFADLLARHAEREEKLLYRWADESVAAGLAARVERHATAH
jgi:hypothetical protein